VEIDVPDIKVVLQHQGLNSRNDFAAGSGIQHCSQSLIGGRASPSTVNPAQ